MSSVENPLRSRGNVLWFTLHFVRLHCPSTRPLVQAHGCKVAYTRTLNEYDRSTTCNKRLGSSRFFSQISVEISLLKETPKKKKELN